jgi:hypothetical protein
VKKKILQVLSKNLWEGKGLVIREHLKQNAQPCPHQQKGKGLNAADLGRNHDERGHGDLDEGGGEPQVPIIFNILQFIALYM